MGKPGTHEKIFRYSQLRNQFAELGLSTRKRGTDNEDITVPRLDEKLMELLLLLTGAKIDEMVENLPLDERVVLERAWFEQAIERIKAVNVRGGTAVERNPEKIDAARLAGQKLLMNEFPHLVFKSMISGVLSAVDQSSAD